MAGQVRHLTEHSDEKRTEYAYMWFDRRMTTLRRMITGLAVLPVAIALASPALVSAQSVMPPPSADGIDYSPYAGVRFGLENPGEPVPGTDENCSPSQEHPRPVILLHGTGMNGLNTWSTLAPALKAEGYCVFAPTYGANPETPKIGGVRRLHGDSGPEIASIVDEVRQRTGAEQVDLVGHSLGGPAAAYVAKVLRPGDVATVVFIASYWMRPGTTTVSNWPQLRRLEESGMLSQTIAMGPIQSGVDLVRPAELIDEVWAGGSPYLEGVSYRTIASTADEVFPPQLSFAGVPGGDDVVLQDGCQRNGTGHMTAPSDPRAIDLVLGALDPADATTPRCVATDTVAGVLEAVPARQ